MGIAMVSILASDVPATCTFYSEVLQTKSCKECQIFPGETYPAGAYIQILSQRANDSSSSNRLGAIYFATDDTKGLRKFLIAHNVAILNPPPDSSRDDYLAVSDPEGHHIGFFQVPVRTLFGFVSYPSQTRTMSLIHAGFVVKDREAMDKFYKDVLGFHVYWQGGMKEGETNWVDMQVPDGTDWIEYMLRVPVDADKRTLGVMNHLALGVPDVRAAANQLEKAGVKLTEQPKIGRDGKWQLNLYDPDQTRVELMEFTPVKKPCCAEYTGPHPKP
jgi:catechol 2,3-dioxygenase-like lactoylglutathione lyase family enzyme